LNFIKVSWNDKIDEIECSEGEFIDKFKKFGFEKAECSSIDCSCINNTEVYECSYVKEEPKKEGMIIMGKILKKSNI